MHLRTSLFALLSLSIGAAAAYGCSSSASAPPDATLAGGSGGGGAEDGGGSGGSSGSAGGGSGGTFISDIPIVDPAPDCDDLTDTDNDGIADLIEGDGDTDEDGTPDKEDLDSDNDGIPDEVEAINPNLNSGVNGQFRSDACSPVANTDDLPQDPPDFQDPDADQDGILDKNEESDCDRDCRLFVDCDGDEIFDVVETVAGSDICDAESIPENAELYFVVPYEGGPKRQNFPFSTGVKDADIYFVIDSTQSMQPAIDNVKNSLDSQIIPKLLNGDPGASPPIKPIPGAFVGVGDVKDMPWAPWGSQFDDVFRHRFCINGDADNDCAGGNWVDGKISPPVDNGGNLEAPANVRTILNDLTASGGGDAPEATTQALYWSLNTGVAGYNDPNNLPMMGFTWQAPESGCEPGLLGRACFRPGKLPVFVIITDAPFHNGPQNAPPTDFDYDFGRPYQDTVDALNAANAKIVGVPVDTGNGGVSARNDLRDLAQKTGSLFFDPAFGGREVELVTEPTATGSVADEVVRLIGLLAGQGLNNVTTVTSNYDCAGGVDCTGDNVTDPEYHNFTDTQTSMPFDASRLIVSVKPVPVDTDPKPYKSINDTTFFGVQGDQTVEFEVTAQNDIICPKAPTVVRALLEVETPTGQALGGSEGVKVIFLTIPACDIDVF